MGVPSHVCAAISESDLLALSKEYSHFNFLLLPADNPFEVLCTVYDYFLLSGTVAFVERAAGRSVDEAREAFRQFAMRSDEPARLMAVCEI